jgi:hypothetical protein
VNNKSKTLNDHKACGANRTHALTIGQRVGYRLATGAHLFSRWLQLSPLNISLSMPLKFAPVQILICHSPNLQCASPRITDFFS